MKNATAQTVWRVNALIVAPLAARPGQLLVLHPAGLLTSHGGGKIIREVEDEATQLLMLLTRLEIAGVVSLLGVREMPTVASPKAACKTRTRGTAA